MWPLYNVFPLYSNIYLQVQVQVQFIDILIQT